MKAWVITEYGGPEVLEMREVEKPKNSKGKLLIEVEYAALNPYDYKIRSGIAKLMTGNKFPKILGGDFSGTIIESNDSNNEFKPGQSVYGFANIFMREQGSLAEFTTISPKYVRHLPDGINSKRACAITSTGLTALNGIRKCGELKDKKVLVNGATGGVGHIATQIFSANDSVVIAVCSGTNMKTAEELGAKKVIDYTKEDIYSGNDSYDIIFDAAAKLKFSKAKKLLTQNGIYCTTEEGIKVMLTLAISKLKFSKSMIISGFRGTKAEFDEMEDLMLHKGIKPIISHNFPFAEVNDAFKMLEENRPSGKVLIKVKN